MSARGPNPSDESRLPSSAPEVAEAAPAPAEPTGGRSAQPSTAAEAIGMVLAGLGWLAHADVGSMPVPAQAECLRGLEAAMSVHTAARARVLAAFCAHRAFEDDLVRDVTEILTSLCARLYGRRAAADRAARAVAAVTGGAP